MATNAVEIQHSRMHFARVYRWILTDGEVGESIEVPEYTDVSVQVYGTWTGGAAVTVEGNLIPDGTIDKFFQAKNPGASLISFTADGGDLILPNYYRMRPVVTGGSGSALTIFMLLVLGGR